MSQSSFKLGDADVTSGCNGLSQWCLVTCIYTINNVVVTHLPHLLLFVIQAELRKANVKVFQMHSKGKSMILQITPSQQEVSWYCLLYNLLQQNYWVSLVWPSVQYSTFSTVQFLRLWFVLLFLSLRSLTFEMITFMCFILRQKYKIFINACHWYLTNILQDLEHHVLSMNVIVCCIRFHQKKQQSICWVKHVMLAGLTWLKHWSWVFVTEPKGKICPFCHYKY